LCLNSREEPRLPSTLRESYHSPPKTLSFFFLKTEEHLRMRSRLSSKVGTVFMVDEEKTVYTVYTVYTYKADDLFLHLI
jgi:hypothetical protein